VTTKRRNWMIWEQRLIEATHDIVFTTHMKSILLEDIPHTTLHIKQARAEEKKKSIFDLAFESDGEQHTQQLGIL
jgi:hypothetical protein